MKVAVIGGGVIGEAMARSLVSSGYDVIVTVRRIERLRELENAGLKATMDNKMAAKQADVVIISVKPKDIEHVLKEIREEVEGKILVSVAAAVPISFIKSIASSAKVIRAMPNLAIMVRESFTAYSVDPEVSQEELETAVKLLSVFGKVHRVEEKFMDAITALSGSAPAYMAVIAEAMTYAGLEIGLDRDLALMIAAHAMISTGKLISEGKKTPSQICAMVTTPGGVTIEGLFELERFPIRHAFMRAVKAATEKARRLALAFK